jgi:hypothetical protein
MDEQKRFCSACGTPMEFRLGQFECPNCGRTEAAAPAADGVNRGQSASGPGAWDPGAQYRAQQPPPGMAPPPPPAGYSPSGYAPPGGYGGGPGAGRDPLRTVKFIYLGVLLVWNICVAVFLPAIRKMMLASLPPPTAGGPDLTTMMSGMMGMAAVMGFIGTGVQALVLFLREVWLKWTCLGCNGCALLLALVGAFGSLAAAGHGHPLFNILGVVLGGWFVFILYRDIQNVQSGN